MTAEESKVAEIASPVQLTEEQAKFLAECEDDFKDRYSESDAEFMAVKDNDSNTPPIVDPWYNKPRRNFDWADRRGRGGSGGGGGGGGGGRYDRGQEGGGYRQHRENHGGHHQRDNQGGYQQHRQGDRYNQQRYRPY